MYNRYVVSDAGVYQRVPSQEPRRDPQREPAREAERSTPPPAGCSPPPPPPPRQAKNPLSGILGKLHLDGIDTGDLLLLAVLFLLFRDGEDEELLIALGLLLIL